MPCSRYQGRGDPYDYFTGSACCPPDHSCTYYDAQNLKHEPYALCCPPGTQGCVHGYQGTGVCCTPPQTCQYVVDKNGYCGASPCPGSACVFDDC